MILGCLHSLSLYCCCWLWCPVSAADHHHHPDRASRHQRDWISFCCDACIFQIERQKGAARRSDVWTGQTGCREAVEIPPKRYPTRIRNHPSGRTCHPWTSASCLAALCSPCRSDFDCDHSCPIFSFENSTYYSYDDEHADQMMWCCCYCCCCELRLHDEQSRDNFPAAAQWMHDVVIYCRMMRQQSFYCWHHLPTLLLIQMTCDHGDSSTTCSGKTCFPSYRCGRLILTDVFCLWMSLSSNQRLQICSNVICLKCCLMMLYSWSRYFLTTRWHKLHKDDDNVLLKYATARITHSHKSRSLLQICLSVRMYLWMWISDLVTESSPLPPWRQSLWRNTTNDALLCLHMTYAWKRTNDADAVSRWISLFVFAESCCRQSCRCYCLMFHITIK